FVNEGLAIVRHFSGDIAQMDISDFPLAAITVHRLVKIAFRHFRQAPDAKFQGVRPAWRNVEQPPIEPRLIHQARLAAHGGKRRKMLLTFYRCRRRSVLASSMTNQWLGSKVTMAANASPAASISLRIRVSASTVYSCRDPPAKPKDSYFPPTG